MCASLYSSCYVNGGTELDICCCLNPKAFISKYDASSLTWMDENPPRSPPIEHRMCSCVFLYCEPDSSMYLLTIVLTIDVAALFAPHCYKLRVRSLTLFGSCLFIV